MAGNQDPRANTGPDRGWDTAELLSHTGWVRTLAARLVLDPQHVDDVVQDVWHAALRRPPHVRSVGAWLTGVVRNVAAMGRRSEERRQQRERQAATGPAASPSTAELAERAELQARLTARVNDLPEAYRDVVLLRFFEDLPPRKIAARLGIPVNTVGSRLTRALARLREDLDGDYKDRRTWGLMFLPLVRPSDAAAAGAAAAATAATTASAGGTAGGTSGTKLLLSAGVVVGVGVGAWLLFDDQEPQDPERKKVVFEQAPPNKPAPERTLIASDPPKEEPAPVPMAQFRGRILDHQKKPVRNEPVAMFRVAPDILASAVGDYSPRRTAPLEFTVGRAHTDTEGRFIIEGNWAESLFVVTWGRSLRYVTETPIPGQPVDLGDLVLRRTPKTGITGRIIEPRGYGIAGARVRAVNLPPEMLEDYPFWQCLDTDRLIYVRRPDTSDEVADFWHRVLAIREGPDDNAVLDRPAWLDSVVELWPFIETQTKADGSFELHGLHGKGGKTTLIVTKEGRASIIEDVTLTEERVIDIGRSELPLVPFARGRVFRTDGKPLPDAEVCIAPVAPNGSPVHFALPTVRTDGEGSFKAPGVTTDTVYVGVRGSPSDPWVVREHAARQFITVRMPPRHRVAFRLRSRKHDTVARPEVMLVPGHRSLHHVRRGLVDSLEPERLALGEGGRWAMDGVLQGRYTLVVRAPAHAAHAVPLWVRGSEEHLFHLTPVKTVTVKVHGQDLEPVKGVRIYARSLSPHGPLAGTVLECGETDAEGTVTIDRLIGESVAITAVHPLHGIAHRVAELAEGAEWHLRLSLPGRIGGRLNQTNPLEKWTVRMRPVDAHPALHAPFAFAVPDETGSFVRKRLPKGRYSVQAIRGLQGTYPKEDLLQRLLDDGSRVDGVLVDTVPSTFLYLATQPPKAAEAAAPAPAPTRPAPPVVDGIVQLSDGRPAAGITLEFRKLAGAASSPRPRKTTTDKKGRFRIRELDDGAYEVVGHGPGPSRCRREIVVRDGKTEPLEVRMTDGVFISGRLTKPGRLRAIQFIRQDASGNWLDEQGRFIHPSKAGKVTLPQVGLDASGRFQGPVVLKAGRYQVTPPGVSILEATHYRVFIQVGNADRHDLVIPELVRWRLTGPRYPIPKTPRSPDKDKDKDKSRNKDKSGGKKAHRRSRVR